MCINIFVEKVFLNTSVDGTPANEKADPVVAKCVSLQAAGEPITFIFTE